MAGAGRSIFQEHKNAVAPTRESQEGFSSEIRNKMQFRNHLVEARRILVGATASIVGLYNRCFAPPPVVAKLHGFTNRRGRAKHFSRAKNAIAPTRETQEGFSSEIGNKMQFCSRLIETRRILVGATASIVGLYNRCFAPYRL